MATTKTTAPSSLASIGSGVANIASQAQKGFATQSDINAAKSQLASLSSQLQSGVQSGAYKSGTDYAELDRPVEIARATTEQPVITPESLKFPAPSIPVFKPTDFNAPGILAGLKPGEQAAQEIVDKTADSGSQLFKQMQELIGTPPSAAESYNDAQRQSGVLEKQKMVNDLSSQLGQITAQAQANQLALVGQGRGIPEAIIGGQQAQIAREAAIQALPVSASLQAAQGNLEMANQNLNTLFQIKSQDATNQYNYKKELVKGLYDLADRQEQRKLDYAMKLEDRKYNEQKDNSALAQSYAQMALTTGQGTIAGQLAKLDGASPTFKTDLARLSSQINDPSIALDREIKQLQKNKLLEESKAPTLKTINGVESQWDSKTNSWIPAVTRGQGAEQLTELQTNVLNSSKSLLDKFNAGQGTTFVGTTRLNPLGSWAVVPGTDVANFKTNYTNLKSLLSLDNIKLMKGQGQISDGERKTLEQASSSLDPSMSEKDFKDVLTTVYTTMFNKTPEGKYLSTVNAAITGGGESDSASYANMVIRSGSTLPIIK